MPVKFHPYLRFSPLCGVNFSTGWRRKLAARHLFHPPFGGLLQVGTQEYLWRGGSFHSHLTDCSQGHHVGLVGRDCWAAYGSSERRWRIGDAVHLDSPSSIWFVDFGTIFSPEVLRKVLGRQIKYFRCIRLSTLRVHSVHSQVHPSYT